MLGATGSIGSSTLDVVRRHPNDFKIITLVAQNRVAELADLAKEFQVKRAVIGNADLYDDLKQALEGTNIEAAAGRDAVVAAGGDESDIVMSALVGIAGLEPTLAAAKKGKTICLVNKESIVCGGQMLLQTVADHGATLIPVDSEHSALFQVWSEAQRKAVKSITITASGGPFRTRSVKDMASVTVEEALAHPKWNMGAKNSLDSANLMNKGLELIEAKWLFDMPAENIEAVIHPQAIIHGMVSFVDGSSLAQLGYPDMKTPIACALAYPERIASGVEQLDLTKVGEMTFEPIDLKKFPAMRLARTAAAAGQSACLVFNTANEVAGQAFLDGKIGFLEIVNTVEECLNTIPIAQCKNIDDINGLDQMVRQKAQELI